MPLNKQFVWENELWAIPTIYPCTKGLIVDFCLQVPAERIRTFMDQWKLSAENIGGGFTFEQRIRMRAENPLSVQMNPKVVLNGAELSSSHGCSFCWNPHSPDGNSLEAWSVMRHYGLDYEQGYVVWRSAFLWQTKRKLQIKALSVTLMQEPVATPGVRFEVSSPGAQIEFIHPSTGKKHTLIVQEYERQELSAEHFNAPDLEFPKHYTMMSYTLSPDLPDQSLTIADCARGDRPRQKRANSKVPQATGVVCCVGIIGRADGPTAIVLSGGNLAPSLHRHRIESNYT